MAENRENPFERSSKLLRSPTLQVPSASEPFSEPRTSTIATDNESDSMNVEAASQSGTKRTAELSPGSLKQGEKRQKGMGVMWSQIETSIDQLENLALHQHKNTQKEIKNKVSSLKSDAAKFGVILDTAEFCQHDEEAINRLAERTRQGAETIKRLKDDISVALAENKRLKERVEQLEREKTSILPRTLDDALTKLETPDDVAELVALSWDRSCFRRAKTTVKSIQSLAPTRIVIVDTENAKDRDVIKKLSIQYPALADKLSKQAANMPIQIKMREEMISGDEQADSTAPPIQRILMVTKASSAALADIAKALKTTVNRLSSTEQEQKLTIHITHAVDVTTALKLAECCLNPSTPTAELCAKGRKLKRNSDSDAETLVITNDAGKSYAEIVREMKEKIDPAKQEVKIMRVSKTREGHAAVQIREGDAEARRRFQQNINQATGSTVEVRRAARTQIIIHDLEETNTVAEIEERIREETEEKGEILVKEPRESRSGALTSIVTIPRPSGQWLIRNKRIRIGWNSCRITQRIYVPFCSNCATAGHTSHQCKQPKIDNKICYKCTQQGHEATSCTNEAKCNTCNVSGHQGISMECPKYSQYMETKIKQGNRARKAEDRKPEYQVAETMTITEDDQSTAN